MDLQKELRLREKKYEAVSKAYRNENRLPKKMNLLSKLTQLNKEMAAIFEILKCKYRLESGHEIGPFGQIKKED